MALPFLQSLDLKQNQILNLVLEVRSSDPSSPVQGQIWFNTTANAVKIHDSGANRVIAGLQNSLDQFAAAAAAVSMGGQLVQNVATPVSGTDAANKNYVDNVALGLDVKASVRAATTVAGTLASSFANGSVIDGVTLATGDRILIKNQASGAENGIYVVNASGAPTRSSDCNSSTTYITGAFVFVENGTVNQGGSWIVNTSGTITVGTTSVSWVQFTGSTGTATNLSGGALGSIPYQSNSSTTAFLAGNTAATDQVLVSHGNGSAAQAPTLSNAPALSAANMTSFPTLNQNTTGTAAGLSATLVVGSGGTGATTAAGARTNLGATGKYATTFGDGSATSYTITHNLGTNDVIVGVYYVATPFQVVQCETQLTNTNTVTLLFSTAPAANSLRCVVVG